MSKRLISFLLAFIMVIGSFTPAFANGIIIGGDESEDTTIIKEENINNDISIYEDEKPGQSSKKNNSEGLESSIVIQSDEVKNKKQTETPSSLVIDNNNTEIKNSEDTLEVSDEKRPEAQTAVQDVPPAKDFNEEITEFKQYVKNVTNGQPDSDFVEELNFHQTPGKKNKIEHKFTLKTRPLSRDYAPGELKIDLTGIEKTREYLDTENNMAGCKINGNNIIANSSEFFKQTNQKNNHGDNPLFTYYTELTNKTVLKKGETIDVSYMYQEIISDIYMKNNSTVATNVYLNGELMHGAALVTYSSNIVNDSFYPINNYWYTRSEDNATSYKNSHLGEMYGFKGKDYRIINIGHSINSSTYLDKSRKRATPIYSRLLADFEPYIYGESGGATCNTDRTLMLNTPLNGTFPKLVLNADKDLIYLRADGTVENFKAGSDIVLVENGQIIRDFGERKNTIEKEKENIGIFFVKRDEIDTVVNVSIKLKNTYFKDDDNLIPEKVIRPIKVYANKKLPPDQEPKIINFSADINFDYHEEYLSYKDIFSGTKTLFSPGYADERYFKVIYNNVTDLEPTKSPKTIKILEVVYNKNNPSENYIYEAKSFDEYDNSKVDRFTEKGYTATAYRIFFEGIENLYKKLDPKEYNEENYAAKRIYVVEDTGGENGGPFFKNIKTADNYDKLPKEIKNSLGKLIDPLRKRDGVAVYQLEDEISQVPLIHFNGGRQGRISMTNGYKLGDQFIFNSKESNYFNFSIFQNILAAKDDDLEITFEIPMPAGVTYVGTPKLTVMDEDWTNKISIKPEVKNINGKCTLLFTLTGKEIKEINKDAPTTKVYSEVINHGNSFRLKLPGKFIVDKEMINNFNGDIYWGSDCTMRTTVKTSTENIKIFTKNKNVRSTFERHIVKPSDITKTDDGKFLFTYTGTSLNNPATTLDCYNSLHIYYEKSPEFIAGISNAVKGPEDQSFTIAPKMINFKDFYENKITIQTASTPMTDVVIYNDIENANPEFLNWKGTLKNIDVSELTNQGFVVETYINKAKHSKNIKEDGWEKYNGSEDLSDVKSLAFKIMDKNGKPGVLSKESEYSIVLKMQAPSEDKVPKVDGKPTHSYSKVFTDWRSVNDNTMSGAESFTVKLSMVGSITDDIIAKVNHRININRTYSDGFTDKEKEKNNIVILTDIKTGNKYMTSGNTLACVEPGKYNVSYITKKGVIADGDKTVEIIEEYKDSVNTINVNYKLDDSGSSDGPGYVDEDSKENLFKITVKEKKIIHIR